jgi:hypothetical protein
MFHTSVVFELDGSEWLSVGTGQFTHGERDTGTPLSCQFICFFSHLNSTSDN